MMATKKEKPVVKDFSQGHCDHCGEKIFDPKVKYSVSYVDDIGGRPFHQWVCKNCGFIVSEWAHARRYNFAE